MKLVGSFIKIIFLLSLPILVSSYDISRSSAYYTTEITSAPSYTLSTGDWVAPPIPTLISPANNSYRNTAGMIMDWSDVHDDGNLHDPVYYIYQSSRNNSFSPLAYQSGKLSSSQIPAPGTPDGVYYWRVKACDTLDHCSDWSNPWKVTVDNISPSVLINTPTTTPVSGIVPVRITVTDVNLDHYWLVIQNSSGVQVAGPGTVNRNTSLTNYLAFNWDTTAIPDGFYTVKLEARDAANNKTPNLAPVPSDPEIIGDSVDWITLYVGNDKTPPTTNLLPGQPTLRTTANFTIGYTGFDDNFDYIELCYSFNLSDNYTCGYHRHTLAGSFNFDSPQGNGLYSFYTIGHDLAGNVEDVKGEELTVQVDTIAPTTNLDSSSITTPKTTGQNLLANGGFELGTANWTTTGDGDHHVVSVGEDTLGSMFPAATGNEMFVLGNKDTVSGDVVDSIFRTVVLPQKIASSLSFSYRALSQDSVDSDQFRVQIRTPADIILESILVTGGHETGGNNFTSDSGWRSLNHSLVDYAGQTIKLWFEQSNTDIGVTAKSWTYIDDICINTLDLRVGETVALVLDTHDTGSGLTTTEPAIVVATGDTTVTFTNTDIATNVESPQSASVIVQPKIVLNKINSDNSVEIYNNTSDSVNLSGYKVNTLDIGPTSLSAHTALTITGVGFSETYVLNDGTTEVDISPVIASGENWQRTPVGVGTWNKIAASMDFNLVSRQSVNKITLSVFNISTTSNIPYEVLYTNSVGAQGFAGEITPESVVDSKTDRDFFLGTCSSGGVCTPETVTIGSTIAVTVDGTTKYFKY